MLCWEISHCLMPLSLPCSFLTIGPDNLGLMYSHMRASQYLSSSSLSSDSVGSIIIHPDTGNDIVGAWKPEMVPDCRNDIISQSRLRKSSINPMTT